MRILVFVPALVPALALLAACATLSEDQCRAGNWYEIGLKDGANGRSEDFLLQHAEACNSHGIRPKATPWLQGREVGLTSYCTPFNAYDIGRKGRHLNPVCPGDVTALVAANDRGRGWHRIENEIRQTRREISEINARLAELSADAPGRTSLISQRSFLRLDLLSLRGRQARYRY